MNTLQSVIVQNLILGDNKTNGVIFFSCGQRGDEWSPKLKTEFYIIYIKLNLKSSERKKQFSNAMASHPT